MAMAKVSIFRRALSLLELGLVLTLAFKILEVPRDFSHFVAFDGGIVVGVIGWWIIRGFPIK